MKNFKSDFDENFRTMIKGISDLGEQIADEKIIREAIIRISNTESSLQINDDMKYFQKEYLIRSIEATLTVQFNGNIATELMGQVTNAVTSSLEEC